MHECVSVHVHACVCVCVQVLHVYNFILILQCVYQYSNCTHQNTCFLEHGYQIKNTPHFQQVRITKHLDVHVHACTMPTSTCSYLSVHNTLCVLLLLTVNQGSSSTFLAVYLSLVSTHSMDFIRSLATTDAKYYNNVIVHSLSTITV